MKDFFLPLDYTYKRRCAFFLQFRSSLKMLGYIGVKEQ